MAQETIQQKETRLKKRKPIYTETYRKGLFLNNAPESLKKWVDQPDIVVRVHKGGNLDDGTEFINITIEGIKPE